MSDLWEVLTATNSLGSIIEKLRDTFLTNELVLERGTLSLALGNPAAIALGTRGTASGCDLNRCFTGKVVDGPCDSTPEAQRAHALAHALQTVEIGIDLHATNLPSTPFLMVQDMHNVQAHTLLSHFGADVLLTDPYWVFAGEPSTLDEFFNREPTRMGVCYETGYASDVSRVTEIGHELLDLLRSLGLVQGTPREHAPTPKTLYELVSAIVPQHEDFRFTDEDALMNFRAVSAEDTIGYDGLEPIIAAHTGILVFPKAVRLRVPRKPVGYIARRL